MQNCIFIVTRINEIKFDNIRKEFSKRYIIKLSFSIYCFIFVSKKFIFMK